MAALEASLWWYRALHRAVLQRLRRLGLPAGTRLLDAGCGTGGLLRQIAEVFPGWRAEGVEFDPEAAGLAARKSGLPVAVGSVNGLDFPDASFDVIVSDDVLGHAGVDEAKALEEFFRCLKPGGRLLLNLPAYEWMKSAHDRHVHNARRYTAMRIGLALQAAGFRCRRLGYWNSLLFPVMALHRLVQARNAEGSDVKPFPPLLDALFFRIADSERHLENLGLGLPFGGSVVVLAERPA